MSSNPMKLWTRRRLMQGTAAMAAATAVPSLLALETPEGNPQPALPVGIVGVMPMFYGMMLVGNHCGPGEIYATKVQSDGDFNLSTYAVQSAKGGMKLVVVNKDFKTNLPLQVKAELPSAYRNAELIVLTQGPGGATLPDLGVYPKTIGQEVGVTLQGSKLGLDGSYKPAKPYTLTPVGKTVSFTVPPLSAVVVTLRSLPSPEY